MKTATEHISTHAWRKDSEVHTVRNRNIDKVYVMSIDESDVPTVACLALRSGLCGSSEEMAAVQRFIYSNLQKMSDRVLDKLLDEIDDAALERKINKDNEEKTSAVSCWIIRERQRRRQL